MAPTSYPTASDYTPLEQHESSTPASFFGGKPVLHKHYAGCRILASPSELIALAEFGTLAGPRPAAANGNGETAQPEEQQICDKVDIFVNSHDLTLANRQPEAAETAHVLRIPYPAISLHATQRIYPTATQSYSTDPSDPSQEPIHAIYLQLDPAYSTHDHTNPDGDDGGAEATLLIVPPPFTGAEGESNSESAQEIFEALSHCADLHPDPDADGDDEDGQGGLTALGGAGIPGAGGWITAENAHEFEDRFADAEEDEEGEAAEGATTTQLGPGAGSKREGEEEQDGDVDDGKWQRTS